MDCSNTYMYQEIMKTPDILENLYDINRPTLEAIKQDFNERGIEFISAAGRGTSENALLFFRYIIGIKMGIMVDISSPSIVTIYGSKMRYDRTMVIAVSQSGAAQDALEIVKQANSEGAMTIAVTNFKDSPLAKTAKYHLFLNCEEEKSLAATKTFSAQLYLLSALVYTLSNDQEAINKLKTISFELNNHLNEISFISDELSEVEKDLTGGFVLARGMTLGLADEVRVKMGETCFIPLQSFSSAAFYHGPMALIEKGTFVLLIAPKKGPKGTNDEYREETFKENILKFKSEGASVYVLTDNESLVDNNAHYYILHANLEEEYLIFLLTLTVQLIACKTAVKRGINPDKSRSLNKVTYTK